MSGDIHVKGGGTTAIGKFSNILKYLDHVSAGDDTLRQQRGTNDEKAAVIPRSVVADVFEDTSSSSSPTSSSISSSGSHQQQYHHQGGRRRRPRAQHGKSSSLSPQPIGGGGGGGESKLSRGRTRAAWNNSTKSYSKAVRTSPSTRYGANSSRGDLSAPGGRRRSRPEAAVFGQQSQPPTTDRTRRDRDHRTRSNPTARDRPSSRPHPDVVNRRYSVAVGRKLSPFSDADLTADDAWKNGGSEETLDYSSSTAGTEAPTATVGGMAQQQQQQQSQRRWVWDEWGDDTGGSSSPHSLNRATTITTTSNSRRSEIGRHGSSRRTRSPSSPTARYPAAGTITATTKTTSDTTSAGNPGPSLDLPLPPGEEVGATNYCAAAEHKHGNRTRSLVSRRGAKDGSATAAAAAVGVGDDDEAACTPAARRAFEDIQATARSMKANLKERRSEVCVTH